MAKETKTTRLLREQNEKYERGGLAALTYQTRMMAVLLRAQLVNFGLNVHPHLELTFVLFDRDDFTTTKYHDVGVNYSIENDERLQELDWVVVFKETEVSEQQRKYNLKNAALAKLSSEERELLGL